MNLSDKEKCAVCWQDISKSDRIKALNSTSGTQEKAIALDEQLTSLHAKAATLKARTVDGMMRILEGSKIFDKWSDKS